MRVFARCLSITIILTILSFSVRAQLIDDRIIQINGVTMTADSLRAVPAVVVVKNQNRGVHSSDLGVFSIVCYKGDTLRFSSLGFRTKDFVIPTDLKGKYYSVIQLMVQDTFYLPETIIRPFMTRDEFDYAFRTARIPDDQYELARKNTADYILRALAYTLPRDGRESQGVYQQQEIKKSYYYGQMPAMKVFDPIAWGEFFQAWKRGDFRKKAYSN